MTTIAEERAKELSRYVAAEIDAGGLDVGTLEALLICAFENAQNDKLEEAARAAEKAYGGPAHTYASENADIYRAQDGACDRIATIIRSLKSKD